MFFLSILRRIFLISGINRLDSIIRLVKYPISLHCEYLTTLIVSIKFNKMKKKHYLLFLLASLFLLTDVGWAQTSATVSGVVIDENGETLPGVSVVEVGTTKRCPDRPERALHLKNNFCQTFCFFQLHWLSDHHASLERTHETRRPDEGGNENTG